ncbi:putative membrane protein [Mycolicibacterium hassiacum DSM 44199]|jgi:hypothetical protein|uniref:Putative membrane protein n=1 Tax=Mycolicibacterium hassiacum (strain DSM 44199 / CIP 105218 / JCM 12690 / 3849) TaxID=1122247 RepID=K5BDL2_MYCHD|nr:hypothetical protein [Mycolicibacterium hassiacum]EKF25945.1 putative membrane protein [Mycolicibacterium hassiacum DSM 44199]MDA4088418.1 membrane protein [Mycolicibacterium hassiacum DSM 44199]PZN19165.1 MAG: hypothetical protein DIU75_15340 [Mycolicibacterium hassiacum]VCT92515.1 hypothetical protein MHAS_04245 [Mycolicibacterium hassiacum DSM 44199]
MFVAGVICLCAAALTAALGAYLLARRTPADPVRQLLRAVAPAQLAAAVMLAAGGLVALSGQPVGPVVLAVCVMGAVATVAAGCWQAAKTAALRQADTRSDCAGSCAACVNSCQTSGASSG